MKLTKFFAASVAFIALTGCNKYDLADSAKSDKVQTITAAFAPKVKQPQSKITFTSSDSGVALAWESGDEFTIYKYNTDKSDAVLVGNFIAQADGDNVEFKAADGVTNILTTTDTYVAVYPATKFATLSARDGNGELALTQDIGDDIYNQLDDVCMMKSDDFIFTNNTTIKFSHEKALLSLKYSFVCNNGTTGGSPAAMSITIGDKEYVLNMTDTWKSGQVKYARVLIDPVENQDVTLNIEMWTTQGWCYSGSRDITAANYVAGGNYQGLIDFAATDGGAGDPQGEITGDFNGIVLTKVDFSNTANYSANLTLTGEEATNYWTKKAENTNSWILDYGSNASHLVSPGLGICSEVLQSLDPNRRVSIQIARPAWGSLKGTYLKGEVVREIIASQTQCVDEYFFENLPNLEYFISSSLKELGAYIFNKDVTTPLTLSFVNKFAVWEINENAFKSEATGQQVDLSKVTLILSNNKNDKVTIVDENGNTVTGGKYWKIDENLTVGPFAEIVRQ